MTVVDITISEEDVYDGAKFVCLFPSRWGKYFTVGKTYTMNSYTRSYDGGEVTYKMIGDNEKYITGSTLLWMSSTYGSGTPQLEFIPDGRLTDEELFTIRLAGPETILGQRDHDLWVWE